MKFKFDSIQQLYVGDNRDAIHGNILGLPVTVRRRMNGWTPHLQVIVGGYHGTEADGGITHKDGHLFHDFEANADDKMAFDLLQERAFNEVSARRQASKESSVKLARAALL